MVFSTLTPFPWAMTPMNNISAPTYRDGITYTLDLEYIKNWLNTVLVPETNDALANAIAEFQAGIANAEQTITDAQGGWQAEFDTFTTDINAAYATFQTEVNAALAASAADITAEKVQWQASFDAFMADVEAQLEALNDTAVANLLNNLASDAGAAARNKLAPGRILIEDYALGGDTSDDQAWTRAIAAARTANGAITTIQGSKKLYEFAAVVDYGGLNGVTFRGLPGGYSTIKAKAGAGALTSAFNLGDGSLPGGNIVFEHLLFDGGMSNGVALGTTVARTTGANTATERVFPADRLLSGIKVRGNNTAGAGVYPTVGDITIRSCRFYGTESLPIFITGAKGHTLVHGNSIERCLDTGFTYNESVTFTNNRVHYSADNGVSLSRGNKMVVCANNTVTDSWFNGVFISGFEQAAGPDGFVCDGNVIRRSYEAGIALFIAPSNGVVSGNVVDTVYRGPAGSPSTIGVGIRVGGYTAANGGEVDIWCKNILITGNELIDCARGGVLVASRTANLEIVGNLIVRPGSATDSAGVTIDSTVTNQNFGVLLSGGTTAADWGEIRIKMNTITDDRATPLANRGTYITATAVTKTIVQFNNWNGTRVGNDEKSYIGPRAVMGKSTQTGDVSFDLTSADGVLKYHLFSAAAGNLFRVASLATDAGLEFGTYRTLGNSTVTPSFTISRATSQTKFNEPPRLPEYTTALRPNAATVGKGSMIYDTDLNLALTSNGTNWMNGVGTTV